LTSAGLTRQVVRGGGRRHPTAQAEFHGLRAFRPGDSPRWIHWRTSARCGELMIREYEDVPSEDLILVVDPSGKDAVLEATIRLAATICWDWCRHKGNQLTLIVTGSKPIVLDGTTSEEHAFQLLECLALLEAAAETDAANLAQQLPFGGLPAAPILLVSPRARTYAEELGGQWHRPVAALDVTDLASVDFYEA
jgi:uncharacterized protein (DUF58 family)